MEIQEILWKRRTRCLNKITKLTNSLRTLNATRESGPDHLAADDGKDVQKVWNVFELIRSLGL